MIIQAPYPPSNCILHISARLCGDEEVLFYPSCRMAFRHNLAVTIDGYVDLSISTERPKTCLLMVTI